MMYFSYWFSRYKIILINTYIQYLFSFLLFLQIILLYLLSLHFGFLLEISKVFFPISTLICTLLYINFASVPSKLKLTNLIWLRLFSFYLQLAIFILGEVFFKIVKCWKWLFISLNRKIGLEEWLIDNDYIYNYFFGELSKTRSTSLH
jgi:hypothetical protein